MKRKLPPGVYPHGSGFRGRVSIAGRRRYGPTLPTPEEAAAWRTALLGASAPAELLTLAEGYDRLERELAESGARDGTIEFHKQQRKRLVAFFGERKPLHEIAPDSIRRYAEARRLQRVSESCIWRCEISSLGRLLRLAVRRGWLPRNPLDDVRVPRIRHVAYDALPLQRIREIIEIVRRSPYPFAERDADVLSLFALSGLRRSEVARMRPEDVELPLSRIWVRGKTRDQHIPITAELRPVLARLLARGGRVEKGRPRVLVGNPQLVTQMFRRWRRRLGEPKLRPHVLRHSFATALAQAGVHPHILRDLMRHADLQMTSRYLHALDAEKVAAASLLSLQPGAGTPSAQSPPAAPQDAAPAT